MAHCYFPTQSSYKENFLAIFFLDSCILFNLFPRSVTVCFCPCYPSCLSGLLKAPSHMSSDPLGSIWNIHQALGTQCWGSVSGLGYNETCTLLTKPKLIFIICINTWTTVVLLSTQSIVIHYYWCVMLIKSCEFGPVYHWQSLLLSQLHGLNIHPLSRSTLPLTSMRQEAHEGNGLASYEKLILIC